MSSHPLSSLLLTDFFLYLCTMILIVDDDITIRMSLSLLLKKAGYEVKAAAGPEEAMNVVRETEPELVLLDMNFTLATSGDEGLTLLKQIKLFRPDTPVILMTAWGSIPLAVEGIKNGAADFITKPWDNTLLLQRIETTIRLSASNMVSKDAFDRCKIIGNNPDLLKVLEQVRRVAASSAPVLIMGENGTGKELIAEAIHLNSPRRKQPFVKVNLGGISSSLFESEMFGHKKGSFTGAFTDREGRFSVADKGTIFLDEIGDLDPNSQVKLLRVLQEHTFEVLGESRPRKVDIRVVSATNANLPEMVMDKTFREDLFYRINLITITLPPLRERKDDIPLLVKHFAQQFAKSCGEQEPKFTTDAMEFLTALPYPGNIRELKNLVERTIIMTESSVIDIDDIKIHLSADTKPVKGVLYDRERQTIVEMLKKFDGNMSKTAAHLGITRQTLYRRMEKYDIPR